MRPRITYRRRLRHIADSNPAATYAELAALTGYPETTVSRILRYEFGDVRDGNLVVVADFDDFRRGASFGQQDFLTSCWEPTWPYGLRLADGAGEVYEVRGFLRKRTWRQRLVGATVWIEPVDSCGRGRRVER